MPNAASKRHACLKDLAEDLTHEVLGFVSSVEKMIQSGLSFRQLHRFILYHRPHDIRYIFATQMTDLRLPILRLFTHN
jgi:hypothetical protein